MPLERSLCPPWNPVCVLLSTGGFTMSALGGSQHKGFSWPHQPSGGTWQHVPWLPDKAVSSMLDLWGAEVGCLNRRWCLTTSKEQLVPLAPPLAPWMELPQTVCGFSQPLQKQRSVL